MRSVPACKTKAQTIVITGKKKHASKGPETEKKKLGFVCPQLRWLTTVCLRGFDRNVQQLFTIFSLHQCLQGAVINE